VAARAAAAVAEQEGLGGRRMGGDWRPGAGHGLGARLGTGFSLGLVATCDGYFRVFNPSVHQLQ
jgi:hypothetical protein